MDGVAVKLNCPSGTESESVSPLSKIYSCAPGFFLFSQAVKCVRAQTSHYSDYGSNFVTLIMAKTQRKMHMMPLSS